MVRIKDHLLGRGVHPQMGQRASDDFPFVHRHHSLEFTERGTEKYLPKMGL
jgi:hypothetical protein